MFFKKSQDFSVCYVIEECLKVLSLMHSDVTCFFRSHREAPTVIVEGAHMVCFVMTVQTWVIHIALRYFFFKTFCWEPLYSKDFMSVLGFKRGSSSMELYLGHLDQPTILLLIFGKSFLAKMFWKIYCPRISYAHQFQEHTKSNFTHQNPSHRPQRKGCKLFSEGI